MQKIVRGVHFFQQNIFRDQRELFERLAQGQEPEALFITCSDSRIDPSLITQTKPGELFIVRNVGNIVPAYGAAGAGEGAAIEYALRALNVQDIIICGHTHCGAINGLLHSRQLDELPGVRKWLMHADATLSIIRERYGDDTDQEQLLDTVKENVLVQIDNLHTHPAVAAALSTGRLKVHGWVYDFETGDIFAYHPDCSKFLPVTDLTHRC
jgi:carbonic anhydrase